MKMLADVPEEENIWLGFEEHAAFIAEMLLNETPPTSAIAIDGEWGSGKSTLLKRVVKEVNEMDAPVKTIEFNAKMYERFDLFASLLGLIKDEFSEYEELESLLDSLMTDVLRNTVDMSPSAMRSHINDMTSRMDSISQMLSDVVKEKVVIFIDELDKCRIGNMLSMLDNINLFLVKNVIVVVAADMEKIRSAWGIQYEKNPEGGAGYVDKLFQTKMPVPKNHGKMAEYIESLAPLYKSRARDLADLFPSNPRKVKLALNFIYSARLDVDNPNDKWFMKIYTGIAWFLARDTREELEVLVKGSPRDFISLAWLCSSYRSHPMFQKYIETTSKDTRPSSLTFMNEDKTLVIATEFVTMPLLEMVKICSADQEAFRILQQYGLRLRKNIDAKMHPDISDDHKVEFEATWRLFEDIVQST
ncbi:MAG: KAP family NTPase [Nitrosopumilus sp.]|nr:KAP family NTPase [Nitrosopumilus sp.]